MRLNSSLCNCLTFHFSIKFRHKGDFFLTATTRFPSENIIHGWLVFGESLACNNYAAVITFQTYKILSQSTINRYAWETFKFTSLLLRLDSQVSFHFSVCLKHHTPHLHNPPHCLMHSGFQSEVENLDFLYLAESNRSGFTVILPVCRQFCASAVSRIFWAALHAFKEQSVVTSICPICLSKGPKSASSCQNYGWSCWYSRRLVSNWWGC